MTDGQPPADAQPWLRRHRTGLRYGLGWAAAAVVIALVVGLFASRGEDLTGHDTSPRARVGGVYGAFSTTNGSGGRAVTLRLPNVSARVEVASGADSPDSAYEAGTNSIVRPPAGGRFAVITAWVGVPGPVPSTSAVGVGGVGSGVTLALIADGRRYPLSGADTEQLLDNGRRLVAVGGRPSRYGLAATVDGVTQTFDLRSGTRRAGLAEALYHPARPVTRACGAPTVSDGFALVTGTPTPTCIVQVQQVPWVAGRGWARPGSSYLLVTVRYARPTVLERTVAGRPVRYRVQDEHTSARMTVDGSAATPVFLAGAGTSNTNDGITRYFVTTVAATTGAAHAIVISNPAVAESIDGSARPEADVDIVRRATV